MSWTVYLSKRADKLAGKLPAAARAARRELKALLRAVRARLSTRERIRGLLSLRSLRKAGRGPGPTPLTSPLD